MKKSIHRLSALSVIALLLSLSIASVGSASTIPNEDQDIGAIVFTSTDSDTLDGGLGFLSIEGDEEEYTGLLR